MTEIEKRRRDSDPTHPQPCENVAENIGRLASSYEKKKEFEQAKKEWAQAERVWAECLQLVNRSLQRQLDAANHVTYLLFSHGEVLSHMRWLDDLLEREEPQKAP